ncbi:MAG TPA: PAS domain S-box protein, partial [Devosia sp.]|nr:PAS domain S-box protein [Devosia sp.]
MGAAESMTTTGAHRQDAATDRRRLLELAVNESNAAIYVTDEHANILFVNATFTQMLGYEPHEVCGRRAREILDAGYYAEQDYVTLWSDLRRGRTVRDEVRTRNKAGDEIWLTMVLRPILAPDGSFAHIVGYLEDTTESRQIQSLQRDVLKAV